MHDRWERLRREREALLERGLAVSRRAVLRSRIRELETELHQLQQFPERDPYVDGTVLKFETVKHVLRDGGERSYTYVMLRAGGSWYMTGVQFAQSPMSWASLVNIMIDKAAYVVTMREDGVVYDADADANADADDVNDDDTERT